jgi:hypothetical protein
VRTMAARATITVSIIMPLCAMDSQLMLASRSGATADIEEQSFRVNRVDFAMTAASRGPMRAITWRGAWPSAFRRR